MPVNAVASIPENGILVLKWLLYIWGQSATTGDSDVGVIDADDSEGLARQNAGLREALDNCHKELFNVYEQVVNLPI